MRLRVMSSRSGTFRGLNANSKEVEVYDSNNILVRSFASIGELEKKSEKYLGVRISSGRIRAYCKNEKLYDGKYYFKIKENYIF